MVLKKLRNFIRSQRQKRSDILQGTVIDAIDDNPTCTISSIGIPINTSTGQSTGTGLVLTFNNGCDSENYSNITSITFYSKQVKITYIDDNGELMTVYKVYTETVDEIFLTAVAGINTLVA